MAIKRLSTNNSASTSSGLFSSVIGDGDSPMSTVFNPDFNPFSFVFTNEDTDEAGQVSTAVALSNSDAGDTKNDGLKEWDIFAGRGVG